MFTSQTHGGSSASTGPEQEWKSHWNDVMVSMASQITSLTIVYSTVYSGADQTKHQSSASLAFLRGIHWWPVNSPHNEPVTRKVFPFDYVIIITNGIELCRCEKTFPPIKMKRVVDRPMFKHVLWLRFDMCVFCVIWCKRYFNHGRVSLMVSITKGH